jgi:micrococcal nuclease
LVFAATFLLPPIVLSLLLFFPSSALAATVTAVIDGDTISLSNGTKVRYLGINTPERGQPFYEEAKRFNARLVGGKDVRLETGPVKRDGYGRLLAYVYVGDVLVNARLIAEGLGYLFVIDPLGREAELLRLQKEAQKQTKGMWRDGIPGPLKITGVQADPKGDDRRNPNGEYVRICNVSDRPVALQGFSLGDESRRRYVFPAGTLAPGHTALLRSGKGRDNTTNRKQLTFYWDVGPVWNNDGDTASLFEPEGKLIDSFRVLGEGNE